jgi:hypothetical protein
MRELRYGMTQRLTARPPFRTLYDNVKAMRHLTCERKFCSEFVARSLRSRTNAGTTNTLISTALGVLRTDDAIIAPVVGKRQLTTTTPT